MAEGRRVLARVQIACKWPSGKPVSSEAGMSVDALSATYTFTSHLAETLSHIASLILCSPGICHLSPRLLPWAEIFFRVIFPLQTQTRVLLGTVCKTTQKGELGLCSMKWAPAFCLLRGHAMLLDPWGP